MRNFESFNDSEKGITIKSVECLECGSKNQILFCITDEDDDDIVKTVDHKGRKISNNGNVGSKLKNIKKYDIFNCSCVGECNDEMASFDVKMTLSDGTNIIGEVEVWEYMKNNL